MAFVLCARRLQGRGQCDGHPQAALTTPYVMNVLGTVVLTPNPLMDRPGAISFLFGDPQVAPDESGFDSDFFEEQYLAMDMHYPTRFFGLPGSQNFMINWNSKDFIALGDIPNIGVPGFQPGSGDSVWTLGLSGRGVGDVRPDDVYGLAGYVTTFSDDLDIPGVDIEDETWGLEAYYRIELFSWWHLTPDIQVVGPSLEAADTALLLGLRTKVDF